MKGIDRLANSPFGNMVNNSLLHVNKVMVTIPTPNKLVKKFSLLVDDELQYVHLYTILLAKVDDMAARYTMNKISESQLHIKECKETLKEIAKLYLKGDKNLNLKPHRLRFFIGERGRARDKWGDSSKVLHRLTKPSKSFVLGNSDKNVLLWALTHAQSRGGKELGKTSEI